MRDAAPDVLVFLTVSSAHVAVLALAAWAAIRLLRPKGRAIGVALTLVAIAPVLSGLSEVFPVKAIPVLPRVVLAATQTAAEAAPATVPPAPEAPTPPVGLGAGPAVGGAPPVSGAATAAEARPSGPDWPAILAILWLAGVATLGLRIGRRFLDLARVLRDTRAVTEPAPREVLRDSAVRVGLSRTPRLSASKRCAVPFVAGAFRPRIVVPERFLEPGAESALRFALLHELAHLKRGDHLTVLPELAIRTLYFFHPLVHWVFARMREEREHLADVLVTRVAGRRAPYADFLLEEIEKTRGCRREVPVLALRHGRGAVFRRVHRLLMDGGTNMRDGMRGVLAVALVAILTTTLMALGPAPVVPTAAAEEGEVDLRDYDHVNASPGKEAGSYHVSSVFAKLVAVHVIRRGGPYGAEHTRDLDANQYQFAVKSGYLRLKVPVDDEKEMVIVYGERKVPWAWKLPEVLKKDSVRVLLGDREGVRGEDFEVDESRGVIRFLKKDLCDKKLHYYIVYRYPDDPERPELARGGAIGNHPDRDAVRRFLGLPSKEAPATAPERKKTVGTNASATDNDRVYTLVQAMESEGILVAVASRTTPGDLDRLVHGEDYAYDQETGVITFLRDIPVDPATQYVFVSGVPADQGTFHFHRAIEKGAVKVVVGNRRLEEGTGFTVDYEHGVVHVKGDEIRTPGCQFYVTYGGGSYGNYDDRALLRKLLAD